MGLNEIAKATGLSLAFLRNEVRAGRLSVRRFVRRVLVKNEDLERYLERGSPHSAADEPLQTSEDGKDARKGLDAVVVRLHPAQHPLQPPMFTDALGNFGARPIVAVERKG